jgi:hypothetical protein
MLNQVQARLFYARLFYALLQLTPLGWLPIPLFLMEISIHLSPPFRERS